MTTPAPEMAGIEEPFPQIAGLQITNIDAELSTDVVAEETSLLCEDAGPSLEDIKAAEESSVLHEDTGPSLEDIETAKAHIAYIRAEKGLDTGSDELGANAADLQAALNVYVFHYAFYSDLLISVNLDFPTSSTPSLRIFF